MRIVLADDHPVVRAGVRALVSLVEGADVVGEAGSAEETLTVVRELRAAGEPAQIVLMDLNMPSTSAELGGIAATRALTRDGGPERVIVLTTFDAEADVVSAIDAGARGYLFKDSEPAVIGEALATVAGGGQYYAPRAAAALAAAVRRTTQPEALLTERELDVARLLATGAGNRQIAKALFISEATVKTHLIHVYRKLGATNRTAAVAALHEEGLV
ncbi:response regulator transcription factor [Falsarthrobacter nasiphocae]|uniref:DNA-binding NarL/FixJ family response regulator n=1 Tax=Falsarthrobacter nasiphocae TaxID=189863 RepID=A0AAE3YH42_9MICC|nr:response regulator transcription factor [Falsarthrobacter nasiphocae]MDR6892099.1 DNA-binding NarL/FixJ family response regulator [Falsarthrobacter nasiphocae]